MEKIVTLESSVSAEVLAKVFGGVLASYPLMAETTEPLADLYKGLHKVVEQILKLEDSVSFKQVTTALTTLVDGTEPQLEILAKTWIGMRNKVMLDSLLAKRGGMLGDEDRYKGMSWEFRMITAGKGIQGISQPIALLQLNAKSGKEGIEKKINVEMNKESANMLYGKLNDIERAIMSHSAGKE